MPFYAPNITHPNVTDSGPRSDGGTATATPAAVSATDHYLQNGVRFSNEDSAEGLLVYGPGDPDGCFVHPDKEQWFPGDKLSEFRVARAGSSDVAYSWYAD